MVRIAAMRLTRGLFNNDLRFVRFPKNIQTNKASGIVAILDLNRYDSAALLGWIFFGETNEAEVVLKQGYVRHDSFSAVPVPDGPHLAPSSQNDLAGHSHTLLSTSARLRVKAKSQSQSPYTGALDHCIRRFEP